MFRSMCFSVQVGPNRGTARKLLEILVPQGLSLWSRANRRTNEKGRIGQVARYFYAPCLVIRRFTQLGMDHVADAVMFPFMQGVDFAFAPVL